MGGGGGLFMFVDVDVDMDMDMKTWGLGDTVVGHDRAFDLSEGKDGGRW